MARPLRECDADFSAYSIGTQVPTLVPAHLPTANLRSHQYQASVLLPALQPPSLSSTVTANLLSGIHHFRQASVIFVNRHKVNIGAVGYGGEYHDEYGFDEDGNYGPYLMWSGQRSRDASQEIHAILLEPGRDIHLAPSQARHSFIGVFSSMQGSSRMARRRGSDSTLILLISWQSSASLAGRRRPKLHLHRLTQDTWHGRAATQRRWAGCQPKRPPRSP